MSASIASPSPADRLAPRLLLLWAGLSIGVAFLATPAKFLAPSLSLPAALDVGRQTFRTYNHVELALFAALVVAAVSSKARGRWYLALAVPGAVVVAQTIWLIPALDIRVAAVLAGDRQLPPSHLHGAYVAVEGLKVLWLLGFGSTDPTRRKHRDARPSLSADGEQASVPIPARWPG